MQVHKHTYASRPSVGAAQPAKTACPPFDPKLTKEQMQPFVLATLLSIKPRSCSALDLSYLLWPEETAMRSCMKRAVRCLLVLWQHFMSQCINHLKLNDSLTYLHSNSARLGCWCRSLLLSINLHVVCFAHKLYHQKEKITRI